MDKLLIVDDEDAMRRLLRINLADKYEIIETGTPEQALAMALQDRPNAILLDLRMPKYSGFELCRTFSSLSSTQLIPLIIISGEAGAKTKSLCMELGAAAYFEKPVDFDALRATLANVLGKVCAERRSEVRVRLRIIVKLRGFDSDENPFEEISPTENLSASSFLCGCTVPLKNDSVIEVYLMNDGMNFVGRACVVRRQPDDVPCPLYAFRFVEKSGDWILR
jgi:DNA-binding response OmpR family regulator